MEISELMSKLLFKFNIKMSNEQADEPIHMIVPNKNAHLLVFKQHVFDNGTQ